MSKTATADLELFMERKAKAREFLQHEAERINRILKTKIRYKFAYQKAPGLLTYTEIENGVEKGRVVIGFRHDPERAYIKAQWAGV